MADIALVFNWALESMLTMSLSELAEWRERARVRNEPPPKKPR